MKSIERDTHAHVNALGLRDVRVRVVGEYGERPTQPSRQPPFLRRMAGHLHPRDRQQHRSLHATAIVRMLRPGGHFMLVVPVYDGLSGPFVRRMDKDPTHIHKLARREWLTWMESRFAIVEWWGMVRYLLPGRLYLHLPTRLGRDHTPAILVVGRR